MRDDESHVLGHRQRLRDRFVRHGLKGFADYEVVELLLTLAIPRGDVKPTAKALIARFENLRGILDAAYRLVRDGIETLEEGTVDRAAVYPRRVVEAALRRNAAAVVFAHNHPNGNVRPSEGDGVTIGHLHRTCDLLDYPIVLEFA